MQMTADQLVQEYTDTVLELHLTRRRMAALEAENALSAGPARPGRGARPRPLARRGRRPHA
ncbi:hypothetical protein [Streptomyces sp. NPDC001340]